MSKNIFFAGLILAASGYLSPAIALAAGIVYGFSFVHPYHLDAKRMSKLLLQVSVVGLGFGMDLAQVLHVGRSGFLYTAISISFAMMLGLGLGRALAVKKRISFLISAGTAICGGSAIAAVAPITDANEEEIAIALGTVFVLNSVALLAFPAIGSALHLTQTQFGLWAALAIHDT
ncbi:MAG: putative sulfate exporter family transporter, partial [Terracidiphilus sp.]